VGRGTLNWNAFQHILLFESVEKNSSRSRGSSGSIVSDYGLDDRAIEVRSPTEAEDFSSSLCVLTSPRAHPASCPMGTGGKARPGRDADHSPYLVPRLRMSRGYISSHPMACSGITLPLVIAVVGLCCSPLLSISHLLLFLKLLVNLKLMFILQYAYFFTLRFIKTVAFTFNSLFHACQCFLK
jgi:hypothetical protein